MNFEAHFFSVHVGIATVSNHPGRWFFILNRGHLGAQKMWIDSESGLLFRAVLFHNDKEKYWKCYTVVFAGKNVAKKFRAEMRLSSRDGDTSLNFNCNVKCLDDWMEFDTTKEFCIIDDHFKIYNKGHIGFGEDKNGELVIPVTVEVKMKKLNLG